MEIKKLNGLDHLGILLIGLKVVLLSDLSWWWTISPIILSVTVATCVDLWKKYA